MKTDFYLEISDSSPFYLTHYVRAGMFCIRHSGYVGYIEPLGLELKAVVLASDYIETALGDGHSVLLGIGDKEVSVQRPSGQLSVEGVGRRFTGDGFRPGDIVDLRVFEWREGHYDIVEYPYANA